MLLVWGRPEERVVCLRLQSFTHRHSPISPLEAPTDKALAIAIEFYKDLECALANARYFEKILTCRLMYLQKSEMSGQAVEWKKWHRITKRLNERMRLLKTP